jgi:biotin carboxyl carrier protein
VAGVTRFRVTDRADGEILGDVDPGAAGDGQPPKPGERPIVLTASRPAATRGRTAVEVVVGGWRFELEVEDAALADLRERATTSREAAIHHGPTEVRAIIPGRVVSVAVAAGDAVVAGQRLLAVEAMKMENELRSPRAGTVDRVATAVGQTVELGDPLVVIR